MIVLFSLDTINGKIKTGILNHLLSSEANNHIKYIDEFVFEYYADMIII